MSKPTNSAQKRALRERGGLVATTTEVLAGNAVEETIQKIGEDYGPWAALAIVAVSGLTLAKGSQIIGMISKLVKILRPPPGNSSTVAPLLSPIPNSGRVSEDATQKWSLEAKVASVATGMLLLPDVRVIIPFTEQGWVDPFTYVFDPRWFMVRFRRWGVIIFLCLGMRRFTQWLWSRSSSPIGAIWTTKFISSTLKAGNLSSSQQRQIFVGLPLTRSKPVSNHTHGASACDRNAGTSTCALAAVSLGLEPYFIQQSLSDVRKARKGDRSYHWPKDLAIPASEFQFDCQSQAAILIDVDYYIDMPALLARHPGTYLVSAFQPTAVAKSVGEYTFRFLNDGRVRYEVSGGATYEHLVWDYSGDTFLVEDVGLVIKTVCSYHIDRKYVDDHHCIILLSLVGKFEIPTLMPTSVVLEGKTLGRLSPVADGHVVMDIVTAEGRFRSVAIIGDHTAVTLPKAQFDAVRAVALIAKSTVTASTVASNIMPSAPSGLPTERMPPGHAAIMTSYLRSVIPHSPPVVFPPSEALLPIYFAKHDYEAPVPLKAFGSPLIGPCYAYAASIASDDRCIIGRVEQFQPQSESELEPALPPTLAGYMAEFAQFLIPDAHLGEPVGEEYVFEKQNRANQRSLLEQATITGDNVEPKWSAFVKKETAVKPSDPRNISSGEPSINLEFAQYMYAFHNEVMKNQEWYAFGMNPKQCAERIANILRDALHAVCADGSRFDGHVKRYARILERICMLRFFKPGYHARVNEVLDAQIGIPGTTTDGRKYQSGYSRGSGSMETSDFNSVLTSFIDYCAWRNTLIDGVKCSPEVAWAKLGIYGGDDSLAGAVDPSALKRSAELMGQDYEVIVIPRGEIGVEFLNRQFGPEIWNGDVNSMANPARLLSKLWTGPAVLHNPLQRFAERASGYYRMDGNSPVVGPIVTVAHALLGEYVEGLLMPWDGKLSKESNWPNEDLGWMNDVFTRFIPDFDHDRFNAWIESVFVSGDAAQLLCAPLCTPQTNELAVPKQSCVVADVLHIIPEKIQEPSPKEENTTDASTTCGEAVTTPVAPKPKPWANKVTSSIKPAASLIQSCSVVYKSSGGNNTKCDKCDKVCCCAEGKICTIDHNSPTCFACAADAKVPKVGLKGKRVERARDNARSATHAKGSKPQGKTLPTGKKVKTDPREWIAPLKGRDESDTDFTSRLAKWNASRASVARRLKIAL